jgi:Lon protease-like protein
MKIHLYPQGTRVRIGSGRFPMQPALVGETGTVVSLESGGGARYGVQLDGEARIRVFLEDELQPLPRPSGARAATGGTAGA